MTLSNNDIKRELIKGNNISIHPLKLGNIKGSSINFTASKMAWKVSDKKTAVKEDIITIPPNDTVCIYTQEAIWISRRIGGTYHPRVTLVSKGLSHISTTLDPGWAGISLVAVNNPTDKEIEIRVGEAFVSIMLYYLNTPSDLNIGENSASRRDIAGAFEKNDEEDMLLQEQWHRNQYGITTEMLKSKNYKEFEEDELKEITKKKEEKKEFRQTFWYPLVVAIVGGIIGGSISFF